MRVLLTIIFALFASAAFAQSTGDIDALTKKEQAAREKSKKIEVERKTVRKDVSDLKKKLAKAAREAYSIETNLTSLEQETAYLNNRVTQLTEQISTERMQYMELLAALQRLEAKPPPTIALSPRNAKSASDAGLLITGLSEKLKERAEDLSLNLSALEITQAQISLKQEELGKTRGKLARETSEITTGLSKKSKLEAKLSGEREAAAAEADQLAKESKTLLDLITKLELEAAKVVPRPKPGSKSLPKLVLPKGTKQFAEAKGGMIRPVSGRIIKKYGRGEKGLTFSGRSGGQVLAPYAGRVEFSGPFKNYDQLVILNVGDGYFVLLTGLDALFIGAGDTVQRGEPVGVLPDQSGPELYIELRRNGSAVNPGPWLAAADVKSG